MNGLSYTVCSTHLHTNLVMADIFGTNGSNRLFGTGGDDNIQALGGATTELLVRQGMTPSTVVKVLIR